MYYTTTWLTAKFLVGIPEQALFTLIYQLIAYWMVGFDSPFYSLYISLVLCVICTGSFGMIIGCFALSIYMNIFFVVKCLETTSIIHFGVSVCTEKMQQKVTFADGVYYFYYLRIFW